MSGQLPPESKPSADEPHESPAPIQQVLSSVKQKLTQSDNPQHDQPVFKRWWFWAIIVVLVIVIIVAVSKCGGPSSTPNTPADNTPTVEVSPTEGQEPTGSPPASPNRDNADAAAVTLKAGPYVVGTDVQPGRYVITPGKGQSGLLSISSDKDPMIVNDVLGVDAVNKLGVPSITTDLNTGDRISISGLTSVAFKPVETAIAEKLTAGNWVVGLDIDAGTYVATPAEGQVGNMFIIDSTGALTTQVQLGGDTGGAPTVNVTLRQGDNIKIMGMSSVTFAAP